MSVVTADIPTDIAPATRSDAIWFVGMSISLMDIRDSHGCPQSLWTCRAHPRPSQQDLLSRHRTDAIWCAPISRTVLDTLAGTDVLGVAPMSITAIDIPADIDTRKTNDRKL